MGVFGSPSNLPLDDLIVAAQADATDDTSAMAAILQRFEGVVSYIANTSATDWNLRQDAAQGARLGLVKAVRAHTPGTAGFRSYARRYMRTEARRIVDAMTGSEVVQDPDILLLPPPAERPGVRRQRDLAVEPSRPPFDFDSVIEVLTIEQRLVASARYLDGYTVAEIAATLGVSVSAVSQRLKTVHKALRPVVLQAVAA